MKLLSDKTNVLLKFIAIPRNWVNAYKRSLPKGSWKRYKLACKSDALKAVGGIRKRVKAFKDKTATAQLAAKLEKEAELAESGIVDRFKEHRKTPLSKHLEDFEIALLSDGLTDNHAKSTRKQAEKIIDKCGFQFWNDLSASKLHACIADMQKSRAAKTCKHYQQAVKQFCNWMVKDNRAGESHWLI